MAVAPLHAHNRDLYEIQIDFTIDLSNLRKQIIGAEQLELRMEVEISGLKALESKAAFGITPDALEKLKEMSVTVEMPGDVAAVFEIHAKERGSAIKDSLQEAIIQMQRLEDEGHEIPERITKELILM